MKVDEWLKSGEYLPLFMRDFHDCKRIFKRINQLVENRKKSDKEDKYTALRENTYPDWVQAHVYVVDMFLWYMAAHGYTLQKTHKRIAVHDLSADLKRFDDEQMAIFREMHMKERTE